MIFIVTYTNLKAECHGVIFEASDTTSDDDAVEIAKHYFQGLYRNDVQELIELESNENFNVEICDTLNTIEAKE